MSAEAMVRATDDQIIAHLTQLTAAIKKGDRRRDANFDDAFREFAKQEPTRTMAIIERLPVEEYKRAVAGILFKLAEGTDADTFFAFVRAQRARGHLEGRLIQNLAHPSARFARDPDGLPEDMLMLFDEELTVAPSTPADDVQATWKEQDEAKEEPQPQPQPQPILWRSEGLSIVPEGIYPLLSTIWWGRLLRDPCEADAALTTAIGWLQNWADDPKEWEQFALSDLEHIRVCSPDLIVTFIDLLFERMPSLAGSEGIVRLLVYAWSVVTVDDFLRWARLVRAADWPKARQAYGELIGLRHLVRPEEEAPRAALEALLAEDDAAANRGLAFAGANMWQGMLYRDVATDLMVRVAATGDAGVDAALIDAFRVAQPVPNDGATKRVLRAMVDGGVLDRSGAQHNLLQTLVDLVSKLPDEVADAADAIIRHAGRDLGDIQTRSAGDAHELIQVAVGLQSLGGQWRARGLDLFEALLKVEAYEVENVLVDLDGPRPQKSVAPRARLRRRRR